MLPFFFLAEVLMTFCSATVRLRKVQDVDASLLSIHPACVVSVSLTHLKTESLRQRKESERESVEREILNCDAASLIMNVRYCRTVPTGLQSVLCRCVYG
jgi:hypothetical protein